MRRQSFELNDKEQKVYDSFPKEPGEFITIEDLARKSFDVKRHGASPKSKGNSWTRNSLRKLLRLDLVKQKGSKSGEYTRTKLTPAEVMAKAERRGDVKKEGSEAKEKKAAKPKAKKAAGAKKASGGKKASAKKTETSEEKKAEEKAEEKKGEEAAA